MRLICTVIAVGLPLAQFALGQTRSFDESTDLLSQMRQALETQQKQLQTQEKQIQAQEKQLQQQSEEIEELKSMIRSTSGVASAVPNGNPEIASVGTASLTLPESSSRTGIAPTIHQPPVAAATQTGGQQPAFPQGGAASPPAPAPRSFNPTQEVAGEVAEGPALDIGPAKIRFGGYLGLTGIHRDTNSGNGTGTSFNSIPFSTKGTGNVSETRLTANASRLTIRADADFPDRVLGIRRLSGYFEMDFNGYSSGTNDVTSSSAGFRLRHAFGEVEWGKGWLFGIGQAFSLMTPQKGQISMWPSDVEMSQAVDTNYLAGMIWGRIPQVRLTWRPSKTFSWGFSLENPEQQLGKAGVVTLPSCCSSDLDAQFNTGGDELKVPDLMPDYTTRVAFDRKTFHLDFGGVIRVFRDNVKPYTDDHKQVGGGGNVNFAFKPVKGTKILAQGSYGAGIGRYVGGLIPDVTFKADGSISPIRTASWVTGFEQSLAKDVSLAGYYNGVYASASYFRDTNHSYIGYGFPGSPDSNNRLITEWTGVLAYRVFKTETRGSVQWNTQFSWLNRGPWSRVNGLGYTDSFMFFTQMRYNLP